ncbi:MAG: HD domain-containing protein [Cyanobacteriota bacterium]|nr:HD domain-containing protein [Cyanobacteriota bacterium]
MEKQLLSHKFEEALVYATKLHAGQVRKSGNAPYISHLLSVAALVLEDGGREVEAIAALLHDAIEDQGGDKTRQEIYRQFGTEVGDIVESCTESDIIPKPSWKERKLAAIAKLRSANSSVRRVVIADKLHNARSLLTDLHRYGNSVWDSFKGGKDGTLWFYRSLVDADKQNASSSLADELERVVVRLEQFR